MKINKRYRTLFFLALLGIMNSCENYLDNEPEDFLSEESYFNKPADLELFVNKFYTSFTVNGNYGRNSLYAVDNNSDNQVGPAVNNNLVKGYKLVPSAAGRGVKDWNFANIRECNYFIKTIEDRIENGVLDSENQDVKHFKGENYFFRAWFYFNKLQSYGDFPIITEVLSDDTGVLIEASKRSPRNKVARFILQDLEKAISLLDNNRSKNRISKPVAYLLASRVALFEGTWLKYHQGTARVPGGPDWKGGYLHPNFAYESGSIEEETNFFLDKAMYFSQHVGGNHSLASDYQNMFVTSNLEATDEVLLYKSYGIGAVTGHGASHYLQRTGAGCGFTRSLVESFLMKNGLPIYASASGYKGDVLLRDVVSNRDSRLQQSVLIQGDIRTENMNGSKDYFDYPELLNGNGWQGVTTGYQLKKWMSTDPLEAISNTAGTTDCPIFRVAEAYLNYIEASYLKQGNLDAIALDYWIKLRQRAQVDTDILKTIANTDLTKERDLAKYSGTILIDATLFNIRRERRNEFIAEGMRLTDLYRWRSLDNMQNYIVEGYNLWDENYLNQGDTLEEGINTSFKSENGGSKYLQPLRKSNSNIAFDGYNFPEAHYLTPVPLDQFALTNSKDNNGVLYQNPGWSSNAAAPAN